MYSLKVAARVLLITAFIVTGMPRAQATDLVLPPMPLPGVRVSLSPEFVPSHLAGMTIHMDNALRFDFLIHRGDEHLEGEQKREEYRKLVKYFLASLTIPDQDQWVNLSPYEKERIISNDFGQTTMGRDLLEQDYLLKQITSSLMYPESGLGQKFWARIYERAWKEFHTTQIPVNTFNKVWIVPDQAIVYESGNTAYILKSTLKVMLEEDYLASEKNQGRQPGDMALAVSPSTLPSAAGLNVKAPQGNTLHALASDIIRSIILPELQKEVNEGKNFATLRQAYSGMILATWYKKALKESLLGKIYADKDKVKGVDQNPKANVEIYNKYLKAFKKGVYNYIKEDTDQYTNEIIPRKYFSGGFERVLNPDKAMVVLRPGKHITSPIDNAALAPDLDKISLKLAPEKWDAAMRSPEENAGLTQRFSFVQARIHLLEARLNSRQNAVSARYARVSAIPVSSRREAFEKINLTHRRLNTIGARMRVLAQELQTSQSFVNNGFDQYLVANLSRWERDLQFIDKDLNDLSFLRLENQTMFSPYAPDQRTIKTIEDIAGQYPEDIDTLSAIEMYNRVLKQLRSAATAQYGDLEKRVDVFPAYSSDVAEILGAIWKTNQYGHSVHELLQGAVLYHRYVAALFHTYSWGKNPDEEKLRKDLETIIEQQPHISVQDLQEIKVFLSNQLLYAQDMDIDLVWQNGQAHTGQSLEESQIQWQLSMLNGLITHVKAIRGDQQEIGEAEAFEFIVPFGQRMTVTLLHQGRATQYHFERDDFGDYVWRVGGQVPMDAGIGQTKEIKQPRLDIYFDQNIVSLINLEASPVGVSVTSDGKSFAGVTLSRYAPNEAYIRDAIEKAFGETKGQPRSRAEIIRNYHVLVDELHKWPEYEHTDGNFEYLSLDIAGIMEYLHKQFPEDNFEVGSLLAGASFYHKYLVHTFNALNLEGLSKSEENEVIHDLSARLARQQEHIMDKDLNNAAVFLSYDAAYYNQKSIIHFRQPKDWLYLKTKADKRVEIMNELLTDFRQQPEPVEDAVGVQDNKEFLADLIQQNPRFPEFIKEVQVLISLSREKIYDPHRMIEMLIKLRNSKISEDTPMVAVLDYILSKVPVKLNPQARKLLKGFIIYHDNFADTFEPMVLKELEGKGITPQDEHLTYSYLQENLYNNEPQIGYAQLEQVRAFINAERNYCTHEMNSEGAHPSPKALANEQYAEIRRNYLFTFFSFLDSGQYYQKYSKQVSAIEMVAEYWKPHDVVFSSMDSEEDLQDNPSKILIVSRNESLLQEALHQLETKNSGYKPVFEISKSPHDGSFRIELQRHDLAMATPTGGIDFNSAHFDLQIKRDGRGMPLPLAQQDMAQLGRIEGFVPKIIEIKPVTGSLPVLSEIESALSQKTG